MLLFLWFLTEELHSTYSFFRSSGFCPSVPKTYWGEVDEEEEKEELEEVEEEDVEEEEENDNVSEYNFVSFS